MILDGLTGQPIDQYVPEDYRENLSLKPGTWTSFDNSPYDTLVNNFYYDGANYHYYLTDSGAIDFSANPVFNGELFTPIEDLVNTSQIQNGGTIGTRNFFAADQAIGLINGDFLVDNPDLVAATNRDILNSGDLQDLVL